MQFPNNPISALQGLDADELESLIEVDNQGDADDPSTIPDWITPDGKKLAIKRIVIEVEEVS